MGKPCDKEVNVQSVARSDLAIKAKNSEHENAGAEIKTGPRVHRLARNEILQQTPQLEK